MVRRIGSGKTYTEGDEKGVEGEETTVEIGGVAGDSAERGGEDRRGAGGSKTGGGD